MNRIKMYWIFFFIFTNLLLFSDSLLLKNGKIFKGNLVLLNNNLLGLKINERVITFNLNLIEFFSPQLLEDNKNIFTIKDISNKQKRVMLIKLTDKILYYCSYPQGKLESIPLNRIIDLKYYNNGDDLFPKEKYISDLFSHNLPNLDKTLDDLISQIFKITSKSSQDFKTKMDEMLSISRSNVLNFENNDFYEKFWARISKFINFNTKNILWQLLDNYTENEKSIDFIYQEKFQKQSNLDQTLTNIKERDVLRNLLIKQFIEYRKEFYQRAINIIIKSELLN